MSLKTITPADARRLVERGAVLIDIRDADEHARERIPGALSRPLDALTTIAGTSSPVIFHCKSGNRTAANAAKLAAAANCEAYLVEGGLDAWRKAGLPVAADRSRPIEIQRQVLIAAGSLMLAGIALGELAAPGYIAISAFVGVGLIFAGLTGWCGMAKVLAVMPWNRRPTGTT